MARECPNQRVMTITTNGDYESQDEAEMEAMDSGEEVEYPDTGELLVTRRVTEQAKISFSIGKYQDEVVCDVVPMQAGHILLGRPWQFDRATFHNGRTNYYSFKFKDRKYNLAPLSPSEVHELQTKMNKEDQECLSTGSSEAQQVPKPAQAVLDKFQDLFPEEIPAGLPPIRGIEHQIDLVPGSALPNKPAYRMNPEETKELEKQVQDLMNKG
ncbi:uncharacterized protein LOC130507587, partial [Raphanus sativus]|uniref:Uncharacterized protein LOC130507587 n=1 Tax=Raphanus sativus TaxID=3726 RepID=A0A9W3D3E8_RAPSA